MFEYLVNYSGSLFRVLEEGGGKEVPGVTEKGLYSS